MFLLGLLISTIALSASASAEEPISIADETHCLNLLGMQDRSGLSKTMPLFQEIATQINLLPDPTMLDHLSALGPWRESKGMVNPEDRIDLNTYPRLTVRCPDQTLYPTHPDMILKRYHMHNWAQYNANQLSGEDAECRVVNQANPRRCAAGQIAQNVVLSDTYQDSCGNRYRGFTHRS